MIGESLIVPAIPRVYRSPKSEIPRLDGSLLSHSSVRESIVAAFFSEWKMENFLKLVHVLTSMRARYFPILVNYGTNIFQLLRSLLSE